MGEKITEFSDDSIRQIAKEVVVKRYALIIHFWAYIFVNIILAVINYFTDGFEEPWCLWPLTAWFIMLGMHFMNFLIFKKGLLNTQSVILVYHITLYILVNLFLVFTNWFIDGSLGWVFWAIGGWGLGLLAHIVLYIYSKPKKEQAGTTKSWMDRKIEEEIKKANSNVETTKP